MLSTLPFLRRPATAADRLPASLYFHGAAAAAGSRRRGEVYVRYIRRVRVADGTQLLPGTGRQARTAPAVTGSGDRCYRLEVAALRAATAERPTRGTRRDAPIR